MITNGPQSSGGSTAWSAQQNIKESETYYRLLEQNARFRAQRERLECGPIADPQLHQQCLQSFTEYSPYRTPTPTYATLGSAQANYGATGGANYRSAAGGSDNANPGTTGSGNGGATGPVGNGAGAAGAGTGNGTAR